MIKVNEIIQAIESFAPPELAENWDNVGLLVGDGEQTVERVFLCLDATSEVVKEAVAFGANMIISHHPLFISPVPRIIEQDVTGRIIRALARNDISLYAAHTNFDSAPGGLCEILTQKLELRNSRKFTAEECLDEFGKPTMNFGHVSSCAPTTLAELTKFVQAKLNTVGIRYVGDPNRKIETVATCCGGGSDMLFAAYRAEADVLVTGDVKYHGAQLATEFGVAMIDAGHFETEVMFCEFMREFLGKKFPALEIENSNTRGFFNIC